MNCGKIGASFASFAFRKRYTRPTCAHEMNWSGLKFVFPILLYFCPALCAQQVLQVALPDIRIAADRLVRGDGDTYGLGDWQCTFKAVLKDSLLMLKGTIAFSEKSNDFTTILGEVQAQIAVKSLAHCKHCTVRLAETQGTVSGVNIGARGYRWFPGRGLIRRAYIQTDTFGDDVGHVGGTIQFEPLKIWLDCAMAVADDRLKNAPPVLSKPIK